MRYFLEQCLLSVQKAIDKVDCEVFVVDNRSSDGSCDMVRQKFQWVKLIENKDNVGFSKANNQAMRIAKGEYILLLNPDTIVEEDTFEKCVNFMDNHPKAGGLGVRMIDGKGNFLPESKRGLPTPEVAFYKIFGLSSLFPNSKRFGQYHLSYLDEHQTHKVDILAGAYMLMRKTVLDKVGLLDEDFFMYGEDIDLSWRIRLGGYDNYYYPETRIIHYKGESTKKSSINYVFVFYNAMIIFAKKHFSKSRAGLFTFLIQMAIYFRASLAILRRFLVNIWCPAVDFTVILGSLYAIQAIYSQQTGIQHPESLLSTSFPTIALIFNFVMYYAGSYDLPQRLSRIFRGILFASVLVLTLYALLPESMRFSRAIVLLGAGSAFVTLPFLRVLYHIIGIKDYHLHRDLSKRVAIVGFQDEIERVKKLMTSTLEAPEMIIEVVPTNDFENTSDHFIATIGQLKEVTETFKINEVIFCGDSLSSQDIIHEMSYLGDPSIEYKIAPRESEFIIGSNSIHTSATLYAIENLNAILIPANQRMKRTVDVVTTLLFLVLSPVLIPLQRKPLKALANLFKVLFGQKTWVGFSPNKEQKYVLPKLRPAILEIGNLSLSQNNRPNSNDIANFNYAKHYSWLTDLRFIFQNLNRLGG